MKGKPEDLLIYRFPFARGFIESRSLKEGREEAIWPFSGVVFSPKSIFCCHQSPGLLVARSQALLGHLSLHGCSH